MNHALVTLYLAVFSAGLVSTFFSLSTAQNLRSDTGRLFAALWGSLLIVVLMIFINLYNDFISAKDNKVLLIYFMLLNIFTIIPLIILARLNAALNGRSCRRWEKVLIILSSSFFVIDHIILFFTSASVQFKTRHLEVMGLPHYILLLIYMGANMHSARHKIFLKANWKRGLMILTLLYMAVDIITSIPPIRYELYAFLVNYLLWSLYIIWASVYYDPERTRSNGSES
jgi:hypothetical protein